MCVRACVSLRAYILHGCFLTFSNFFIDVGVYLKANAAVRYSVTDNYVLNLTCGDGSTSDTKVLTVNIGPNSAPIFQSWPGMKNIVHLNRI